MAIVFGYKKHMLQRAKWIGAIGLVTLVAGALLGCGRDPSAGPVYTSDSEYYDKLNEVEKLSKPIYEKADRNEPLTEDDKIKLKDALVIFKALHEFRPTAFTLPFALGKGHQILGDDETALQYFRQTEAQLIGSPGDLERATLAEARYLSVDSLIRLGETEAALEAARLAVDFNSRSANYYAALASAQLQMKRRSEAKKSLEAALRIDPHNARAIRLGQLLLADNGN